MKSDTVLIGRSEVERAFGMGDYLSAVETAFRLYADGQVQMPPKAYLYFDRGDLRCMPAFLPTMNIAGVKIVNVHPFNRDLPAVMATITLIDPGSGFPLAIMDGTHITRMRTGAAGGVAARYLSRADSAVAGFVGAGVQARTQLEALLLVRPGIRQVRVYDVDRANLEKFSQEVEARYGLTVECAGSAEDAVRDADIVVTTTPVRTPIVPGESIRRGTHINAIGADAPGKQELDPAILQRARVVIDDWEQASHGGEINVAVAKGAIARKDIWGEIGEIVAGKKTGRESPDQITVFDSTGLAIQDICAAGMIYRRLVADRELAGRMDRVDLSK